MLSKLYFLQNVMIKSGKSIIFLWVILLLSLLFFLSFYTVNIPVGHEWEFVILVEKLHKGGLIFQDLWTQHDAHRPVLMRIGLLWFAWLTGWNTRAETFANVTIVLLTLIGVNRLIQFTFKNYQFYSLSLLVSIILFSLSQAENWLPGWPFEWFLQNFFFVACLILLIQYKNSRRSFALMLLLMLGSILAYSLVLWFVIGVGILLVWNDRRYPILWFVASLIVLAVYFIGFEVNDSQAGSIAYVFTHLLPAVAYLLVYLGSPLSFGGAREVTTAYSMFDFAVMGVAATWGLIGIIGAFLCFKEWIRLRKSDLFELALPWLLMMLFVFCSAGLTMLGRLNQGVLQALSVRYTTVAGLFWIALIMCIVLFRIQHNNRIAHAFPQIFLGARVVISVMFVVSFIASSAYGALTIINRNYGYTLGRQGVLHYDKAPTSFLKLLHVNAELVRSGAATLEKWKIGPFREVNPSLAEADMLPDTLFEKIADLNLTKTTYLENCAILANEITIEIQNKSLFQLPIPIVIETRSTQADQITIFWASGSNAFAENRSILAERSIEPKSDVRSFYTFLSPVLPINQLKIKPTYTGVCRPDTLNIVVYRFKTNHTPPQMPQSMQSN